MTNFLQDIRYAARALGKAPGFTWMAILTLALGIGANTTAFSLANALQFKPLPYFQPHRLVDLHESSETELCQGCSVGTSLPGYLDWKRGAKSYAEMGAYATRRVAISDGGMEPFFAECGLATASMFEALGVRPQVGRTFLPEEDRPGGEPVAVLGYELWQQRFAGDSRVLGKTVKFGGRAHTIIGVMPQRFELPEFARLWLPFSQSIGEGGRNLRNVGVVARLKPGASIAEARAEIRTLASQIAREHPPTNGKWSASVISLHEDVTGETAQFSNLLLGIVAFVLLIACANVANLMLVRATGQEREIAVRQALGATRWRIVRLLLSQSVLLALAGGGLGFLLALWAKDAAVGAIGGLLPAWIDFRLDLRVLLFTSLISLAAGAGFGLAPALRVSLPNVQRVLKAESGTTSGSREAARLRNFFAATQIALTLSLLIGAGLLTKTYLRALDRELPYDPAKIITAEIDLLDARYRDGAQRVAFASRLLEQLPGPARQNVALLSTHFLAGFGREASPITVEGTDGLPPGVSPSFSHAVTPAYFPMLGIPLIHGRSFTDDDRRGAPGVVIINHQLAQQIWPKESSLGKRIRLGPADSSEPWLTVVGVVGDTRGSSLRTQRFSNFAYVPWWQAPGPEIKALLSGGASPMAFVPALRAAVRAVDPDQPVENVQTMEREMALGASPVRFVASIVGALSAVAFLLAMMGLYGVVAYAVRQRTREIGIRMALGATAQNVIALILGRTLRVTVLGLLIGFAGALALTRFLRGVLFGTSPTDPWVFVMVTVFFGFVALGAAFLPARRAARIDPMVALRYE